MIIKKIEPKLTLEKAKILYHNLWTSSSRQNGEDQVRRTIRRVTENENIEINVNKELESALRNQKSEKDSLPVKSQILSLAGTGTPEKRHK